MVFTIILNICIGCILFIGGYIVGLDKYDTMKKKVQEHEQNEHLLEVTAKAAIKEAAQYKRKIARMEIAHNECIRKLSEGVK